MNESFIGTWKDSALRSFIWFVGMLFNAALMVLTFQTASNYAQILKFYPAAVSEQLAFAAAGGSLLAFTIVSAFHAGMCGIQAVNRFRNDGQDK